MFVIQIEALTGQLYELRCSSSDSVWSVKARLSRSEGILISQQHLIFAGRELKDSETLNDIGVKKMSKIRLVVSMRGGPINTRLVDEEPDDNCVPVDELTETENAFAVLFVKDGEKVNFVRVSVTNDETATTSTPFEQPQQATVSNSNPDSMRALENRRTYQKMQMLRSKMKNRRSEKHGLPSLAFPREAQKAEKLTSLPPIYPPVMPVSNIHSQFLRRYGLAPSRVDPDTTGGESGALNLKPSPPLIPEPPPPKAHRPRCAKCGKRLALHEQYQCKCGLQYCSKHRYAEEHACKFDYEKENKQRLAAANAAFNGPRLPKI
ncbi:Oidioi.mRNA.OKI2018_I69.XSR.g15519.t1.cds [Oikopleura dioica]|uniref:Oidioi.mRNA.OKI2018_I69.XSR.g15519.t1.cds n=1 Tax=Oikopleura dioica TaxID=34765 RepID=A0ABN7SKJ1_OIKDI|nr:Oidioi.mRNA.OKI2018_I69.XSR.g15519.t1.cds [Oikopleura dioica]